MFTRIITSSLLFLIAIGGFVVSYDTGSVKISQSYAEMNLPGANTTTYGGTDAVPAPATAGKETDASSKWLNEGIQAVNALLGVITVIISPVIIFAGWLLSPDWSSGDLFGLRAPMHSMWIIVSNIVYFIYAILLIIIALATIFGKDTFSYKVMLPKLALGILMVPFTWWFVQWTISLSTIVTASVVSIPMETMKDQYPESNGYLNNKIIPGTYTVSSLDSEKATKNKKADCPTDCISIQDILNHDGGIYNTLLIYAYNVFKIQDYKNIDSTLGKISTAGQLLNNVVISAIMILVFGILVMALIAMLLLRAIKLWMYAIFSPVFTLHFVAGKELFGKSTDGFNLKEFIGLCFVPAVVGITLSFGLMIVSIVQIPTQTTTTSADATCTVAKMITLEGNGTTYTGGCTLARLMGSEKNIIRRGILKEGDQTNGQTSIVTDVVSIAGMNIVFRGLSTNISASASSASTINGAFSTAGGIFGTIIIDIIALIFIWMSFMAAKGVSKAVEAAVKPFEEMGNKIGGMATKLPQYMPLPLPGGSIAGTNKAMDLGSNMMIAASDKKFNDSGIGRMLGAEKYVSKDLDAKNVASVSAGSKEESKKLIESIRAGFLNKEYAGKADTIKAIHTTLADDKKRTDFFKNMDIPIGEQEKYNELGKKNFTDQVGKDLADALKGKYGSGTTTTSTTNSTTINNITGGTNASAAVKIIMDGSNNGTITKKDLKEKLEANYKESPIKDKIVKEIIDELEKDKTKFTFKAESTGGGPAKP